MKYRYSSWLAFSFAGTFVVASGCAYTPPEATNNTGGQGGAGQGGGGMGNGGGGGTAGAGGMGNGGGGGGGSGPAGAGGQGGQGGSPTCNENNARACYLGPPGVEGIGECEPGNQVCVGGAWDECKGSVWPSAEACSSGADNNCDGFTGCTGSPIKAVSMGTSMDDAVLALATGAGANEFDGIVYAVGVQSSTGWTTDPPINGKVLFSLRKPGGNVDDWATKFVLSGAAAFAYGSGVAVTSAQHVVVGGVYANGTLEIGGQMLENVTSKRGFLAKFAPNGSVTFAKQFGSGGTIEVRSVATDPAGNIYVVGDYSGTPSFDNIPLGTSDGRDGFVAAFSSVGSRLWAINFDGSSDQSVIDVATTTGGDVFVAVRFAGTMNVPSSGAGNDVVVTSDGAADGLLAKLSPEFGHVLWTQHFGGAGDLYIGGLAASSKNVAIVGGFRGDLNINGFLQPNPEQSLAWDGFVAQYDLNGAYANHLTINGLGTQAPHAVAYDAYGDLVITGGFSNAIALNNGQTISTSGPSDNDAFAVKLSPDLKALWGKQFGDTPTPQISMAVGIGSTTGHVFFGGAYQGQLTGFNNGPTSTGGFDSFVGQLSN